METLKAIAKRKSTRVFSPDEQISKSALNTILAAGCAAPVGKRDYSSVHLTVIQNPEILGSISKTAQNTMDVKHNVLYDAPVLVIVSAFKEQKAPNIEFSNAACIIENMIIACNRL